MIAPVLDGSRFNLIMHSHFVFSLSAMVAHLRLLLAVVERIITYKHYNLFIYSQQ